MYECPGPYLYKDGGAFVKSVEWGRGDGGQPKNIYWALSLTALE